METNRNGLLQKCDRNKITFAASHFFTGYLLPLYQKNTKIQTGPVSHMMNEIASLSNKNCSFTIDPSHFQ